MRVILHLLGRHTRELGGHTNFVVIFHLVSGYISTSYLLFPTTSKWTEGQRAAIPSKLTKLNAC